MLFLVLSVLYKSAAGSLLTPLTALFLSSKSTAPYQESKSLPTIGQGFLLFYSLWIIKDKNLVFFLSSVGAG